ncbi:hypothetical protein IRJ41_004536 [Triplophysa rosa]|uniref:Uncharacterized protein n=1 Tax=Triplophysa rosa TaxID=992332 RepID=A0A9W7WQA7_TRIRA|nr:hypothetical protein IRJ41_004536 [Triplophysa rosa]
MALVVFASAAAGGCWFLRSYTFIQCRQISSVICEWISIPQTQSVQESMSSGRPARANLIDEASPFSARSILIKRPNRGLGNRWGSSLKAAGILQMNGGDLVDTPYKEKGEGPCFSHFSSNKNSDKDGNKGVFSGTGDITGSPLRKAVRFA